MRTRLLCALLFLTAVFVSALAQVLLKAAALQKRRSLAGEYFNFRVLAAYFLLFLATLADVVAYRELPLSLGPVLESSAYLYVTIFGAFFFGEKITPGKLGALGLILLGIAVFTLAG